MLSRAQCIAGESGIREYEKSNSFTEIELSEAIDKEKSCKGMDKEDMQTLLLKFAKLLSEPKLGFEAQKQYQYRVGRDTLFLGVVKIEEPDIRILNILKEPKELVISIPVDSVITIDDDDGDIDKPLHVGGEYYLFDTAKLFCPERNDCEPMDFSPTSTRSAQRDLISLLHCDARNCGFTVSQPVIPTSVVLQGTSKETLSDIVKCFDLLELVRDCHYPIQNQPLAETPKRLAENGLVLRDYQQ